MSMGVHDLSQRPPALVKDSLPVRVAGLTRREPAGRLENINVQQKIVVDDPGITLFAHFPELGGLNPHQPRDMGAGKHQASLLMQFAGQRLSEGFIVLDPATWTDPHGAAVTNAVLGKQNLFAVG